MMEITSSTSVALCSAFEDVDAARIALEADGMSADLPYRGVYLLPYDTGRAYVFSSAEEGLIRTAGWTKVESA